jgi:3-oxoacyl-[acyl-carrier-protein] synthase-3
MAYLQTRNVKISGVAACVPTYREDNKKISLFGSAEEASKFIETTGIEYRRMVQKRPICASDLCFEAAQDLMKELDWLPEDIDCLIFVSQTPDYILPSTAPILQQRLGLSMDTYAMDISLGCSGWVYGLSTIGALLAEGNMKKGLLLVGDTTTVTKSPRDKSTYPLFGDAGTATAIEFSEGAEGFKFNFGTDGRGSDAIMIPDGGFRNFVTKESFEQKEVEPGIFRNKLQSILNGPAVFTFGIIKAPKSVNNLLEKYGLDKDDIDYFVFHQANRIMNEKIRTKLKLPVEKVPYSLREYGNTSSASIPLTIVSQIADQLSGDSKQLIACAFGVGLSWATVAFSTENLKCPTIKEI